MKQAVDHPAQYGHHQAPLGLQACELIELAQGPLLPADVGTDRQLDHGGRCLGHGEHHRPQRFRLGIGQRVKRVAIQPEPRSSRWIGHRYGSY